MNDCTLSFIITNYNHARYIDDALKAVVAQSFRPIEVLVIDDASTDNSVEIIQKYVEGYSFVHLLKNKKNVGAAYNYNKLLQLAKGDYIYSAASDDKVLPEFFERSMALLSRYPQAGLCCSDNEVLEIGKGFIENRKYLSSEPRYFTPQEVVKLFKEIPLLPLSLIPRLLGAPL